MLNRLGRIPLMLDRVYLQPEQAVYPRLCPHLIPQRGSRIIQHGIVKTISVCPMIFNIFSGLFDKQLPRASNVDFSHPGASPPSLFQHSFNVALEHSLSNEHGSEANPVLELLLAFGLTASLLPLGLGRGVESVRRCCCSSSSSCGFQWCWW